MTFPELDAVLTIIDLFCKAARLVAWLHKRWRRWHLAKEATKHAGLQGDAS